MSVKKMPKPISLAYDTHNTQHVVLCDDGSLWVRKYDHHNGWHWEYLDDFKMPAPPEPEKKYRETGI